MAARKPKCPFCDKPAVPGQRTSHFRRGDRVLAMKVRHWVCPGGCIGPDGDQPFSFEDPALMKANSEAASRAWQEKFGQAMPPPLRPGRKAREKRTERVAITFTEAEKAAIQARNSYCTLAEHIRSYALAAPLRSSVAPGFPLVETRDERGAHRKAG